MNYVVLWLFSFSFYLVTTGTLKINTEKLEPPVYGSWHTLLLLVIFLKILILFQDSLIQQLKHSSCKTVALD